jgi:hypothetical protein
MTAKFSCWGQGDAPADQSKEEIAKAAITEIVRSNKLAKDMEKATEKKHVSPPNRDNDHADSDEDGGDGATFGGAP